MIKSIFAYLKMMAVCAGYECIENCYTYISLIYPPNKYTQKTNSNQFLVYLVLKILVIDIALA